MPQLLQLLLELVEVAGGDEALPALLQAVSGQLHQLMVDEAQDPVGQRQDPVWAGRGQQLSQALLHLRRGLREDIRGGVTEEEHQLLRRRRRRLAAVMSEATHLGEALLVEVVHHDDLVVGGGGRTAGTEGGTHGEDDPSQGNAS